MEHLTGRDILIRLLNREDVVSVITPMNEKEYMNDPKGDPAFRKKIAEWDSWELTGEKRLKAILKNEFQIPLSSIEHIQQADNWGAMHARLEKAIKKAEDDDTIGNFAFTKRPIAKMYNEDATVDAKIKELELKKLKLFGKALKMFPSSPRQLAVQKEIEDVFAEIEKLKKGEMEGDI